MMTNEEINRLMQELEKLKTPEPGSIEIPECDWYFDIAGKIWANESKTNNLKYGYKRTTTKACKLASNRMIRTNRLSLLAHILGIEKEFVKGSNVNYYVYENTISNKWEINDSAYLFYPNHVYMTKSGAETVATILNNGEWKLELKDE